MPEENTVITFRLNQYLSKCGLSTRRGADGLIKAGRVTVNGVLCTEMGSRVDPEKDLVTLDGEVVVFGELYYRLFNKPVGEVWQESGGEPSPQWLERAKRWKVGVHSVVCGLHDTAGGLVLMSNDAALNKVARTTGLPQIYLVALSSPLSDEAKEELMNGIPTEKGIFSATEVDRNGENEDGHTVGITFTAPSDELLVTALQHLELDVLRMDRTGIAQLSKWQLPRGHCRDLRSKEVGYLKMGL